MNFSVTYKDFATAERAIKMFNLRKESTLHIMSGEFKAARQTQKEFAKLAVQDFETFKTVPTISFTNVPIKEWLGMAFQGLKFKIFSAFTKKTPEEKQLAKKYNEYIKELTAGNSNKHSVNVALMG